MPKTDSVTEIFSIFFFFGCRCCYRCCGMPSSRSTVRCFDFSVVSSIFSFGFICALSFSNGFLCFSVCRFQCLCMRNFHCPFEARIVFMCTMVCFEMLHFDQSQLISVFCVKSKSSLVCSGDINNEVYFIHTPHTHTQTKKVDIPFIYLFFSHHLQTERRTHTQNAHNSNHLRLSVLQLEIRQYLHQSVSLNSIQVEWWTRENSVSSLVVFGSANYKHLTHGKTFTHAPNSCWLVKLYSLLFFCSLSLCNPSHHIAFFKSIET